MGWVSGRPSYTDPLICLSAAIPMSKPVCARERERRRERRKVKAFIAAIGVLTCAPAGENFLLSVLALSVVAVRLGIFCTCIH